MIGCIEAGGTKFVYGVASDDGEIIERLSCPTDTPDITLKTVGDYFADKDIKALGIGSFGPIDPNPSSPTYGYITTTPKPNWGNVDLVGYFKNRLNVPIGFDTDVNAAALAENSTYKVDNLVYITIGTGIGAGIISEGNLVHGILHPEMGHVLITKHPDDTVECVCPFHKSCLEGLAAGPSLVKRWGDPTSLPLDHKAWEFESYYLAQALANLILTLAPQKIILGGGVMHQTHLFPMIRKQVLELLAGYLQVDALLNDIDNYILPPSLGDNAGFMGAFALGQKSLNK